MTQTDTERHKTDRHTDTERHRQIQRDTERYRQIGRQTQRHRPIERETHTGRYREYVSKLVFYAQSTGAVISGR